MRSMSEVEQNVVSVERILHYVKLDSEAPAEIPDVVPESWPSSGEVEFRWAVSAFGFRRILLITACRDFATRYRPELDLVLRDITLRVVSI